MKTLIIQSSFPRSASTLLVNALYGLVPSLENKKVIWQDFSYDMNFNYNNNVTIIKTHDVNLDNIIYSLKNKYELYFICSERAAVGDRFLDKYRTYKNVLIFDYDDLNETPVLSLDSITNTIYSKVSKLIPHIPLKKCGAFKRVNEMNKRYEEMKNEPFEFVDPFYQIHGSHRRRLKLRGKHNMG